MRTSECQPQYTLYKILFLFFLIMRNFRENLFVKYSTKIGYIWRDRISVIYLKPGFSP